MVYVAMCIHNFSDLLEIESNVKPIWLNDLSCSSSDRSLPACVDEDNVIGFVQCRFDNIAGVDCGELISYSLFTLCVLYMHNRIDVHSTMTLARYIKMLHCTCTIV